MKNKTLYHFAHLTKERAEFNAQNITAAALIEIVNKYGTPSNKLGVYIPYLKYTVEEFFQCL